MEKGSVLTKILAVAGTVLEWLPIAAPILFALAALIQRGRFLFDYLMPAELFLVALVGGGLLIWAAVRARSRRALIGWGLGIAVVVLLAGEGLAVALGFASGEAEPTGWQMALVLGSIVVYTLAIIAVAVGGILLVRDVFRANGIPALKA